jgi:hypothetical protein
MKKMMILLTLMMLTFYPKNLTVAKGLSFPETGEYSFGFESGPKTSVIGDALIKLPEASSLLKFSMPSIDSETSNIQANYGILNLTPTDSNADITLNYIFFRTGYIKDTTLSFSWINEMFGLISPDQEEKVTLLNLENESSYLLIFPDESNQERSFNGIIPSRHGVLLVSFDSSLKNSYQRDLFTFNRLINEIRFVENSYYKDHVEESDPVYSKNLKSFLEDFVIKPILEETKSQEEDTSFNKSFSDLEKELTSPKINNSFKNNQTSSPSNHPKWFFPLGILFLIWGISKGILKNLKDSKNKNQEKKEDPQNSNTL